MRVRAAVLEEFAAPLVVQTSSSPSRARRVLVRLVALRRVPHGPLHRVGRRPVGVCADGTGHEAQASWTASRRRHSLAEGDTS